MKRILLLFLLTAFATLSFSQKAVLSFDEKSYDFGKINEEDGKVTHVFNFTNKGNAPLVISRVQASCGCTTPVWTKEPIEPGKKGSVTVTYNPVGRPGNFTKTIAVYSNSTEEQTMLTIKGEVNSKQVTGNNAYPVNMGNLASNMKVVAMNNVEKGKTQTKIINILNTSKSDIKPIVDNLPSYLSYDVAPNVLKPNEEGKITFTFNSKNCPFWGPVSDDIFVMTNKTDSHSEENRVLVTANVTEDFSKMTLDQKRKAPIVEIPQRSVDMGTLKAGTKRVAKFRISNKGQNSLEIRRIINNYKELSVRASKSSLGGGKSGEIYATVNTKGLSEGKYTKTFTIQTNDPDSNLMILILNWTIKN